MTINFGQTSRDYIVTGVAQDAPHNSSLQFDMFINIANLSIIDNNPHVLTDWTRWYFPFYVQLKDGLSVEQMEQKMISFCKLHFAAKFQEYRDMGRWTREGLPFTFGLQPIEDVYLHARGLTTSFILSAIAIMILVIACINFTNISIGLSSMRATEVGVRKVLGAGRKHLIRQFWIEAIFMCLLAMGFGIFLTTLLLPQFNALSGKQLSILGFFQGTHGLLILSIAIIAGILAGSYPALIMARFQPIDILKHRLRVGGNALFTKGLVVLQFALSGVLVISAVILGNQTRYMLNSDLGYEDEGLVIIRTQENEQRASEVLSQRFRNRLLLHSQIINVTASNREFGLFLPGTSLELQDRKINYRFNRVDPQFISTMGIELIDGTDFSPNLNANRDAVIVNRQFMQALGPSQSVGMLLGNASMGFPNDCRIIGVIEDCHFASLRSEIDPLLLFVREAFSPRRNRFSRIFVRIRTNQIRETIDFPKRLNLDSASFFIAAPFPGTELLQLCQEKSYLSKEFDPDKLRVIQGTIETESFSPESLILWRKKAYREFGRYFLKGELLRCNMLKRVLRIRSWNDIRLFYRLGIRLFLRVFK